MSRNELFSCSQLKEEKKQTADFDSLNRLTKVKGEDGKEISYNGDGLMYERVEREKRTRYDYDEEAKLIAEANVTTGEPNLTYTYIYDLNGRLWSHVDKPQEKCSIINSTGTVISLV